MLLSRGIRDSDVWGWDSEHLRLWVYLLASVHARDEPIEVGDVRVRYGQVLRSYRRIADDNEYVANQRVVRWSTSRVKRMLDRFTDAEMIETLGTDLGTLVTVRNFAKYQDFETYRVAPRNGPRKGHGTNTTNKACASTTEKPDPADRIAESRRRYSTDQLAVIDRALRAFRGTRKTDTMADSVVAKEFDYWDGFEPAKVVAGLRTYLDRGHAEAGRNEKYARGIIRNLTDSELRRSSPSSEDDDPDDFAQSEVERQQRLLEDHEPSPSEGDGRVGVVADSILRGAA